MSTVTLDKPFVFPIRVAGDLAPERATFPDLLRANHLPTLAVNLRSAERRVLRYGKHSAAGRDVTELFLTVDYLLDAHVSDPSYYTAWPTSHRAV